MVRNLLIFVGLFLSINAFGQYPRIILKQIEKATDQGQFILSDADSNGVFSSSLQITVDSFLTLYGDTIQSGVNYEKIQDTIAFMLEAGLGIQMTYNDADGEFLIESLSLQDSIYNGTGSTITKGTPLYAVGVQGNYWSVAPADASDITKLPAVVIAGEDIVAGATGLGLLKGHIKQVSTVGFADGDEVYVGVGGGYTNVKPKGESNYVQRLGTVIKGNSASGSGIINLGEVQSTSNLNPRNIFVGASDSTVTTTDIDTLISDSLAYYVSLAGVQTITGAKTFTNSITGDLKGIADTALRIFTLPSGNNVDYVLTMVDPSEGLYVYNRTINNFTFNPSTSLFKVNKYHFIAGQDTTGATGKVLTYRNGQISLEQGGIDTTQAIGLISDSLANYLAISNYIVDSTRINVTGDTAYYYQNGVLIGSKALAGGGGGGYWTQSGTDLFYNTGNVGINQATPSAKLDVVGDVEVDGKLDINNGYNSVFMGTNVGINSNASAINNTSIGHLSFEDNTSGAENTSIGMATLTNNTTGSYNTAIGSRSLQLNQTGSDNTAIGYYSLNSNVSASDNTAVGYNSMQNLTSSDRNVALGWSAGKYYGTGLSALTTAQYSTYLGATARASADSVVNETVVGYNAVGNGSNSVTIGNTSVTKTILNGNVGIDEISPSAKLDVVGSTELNGALTQSSGDANFNSGTLFVDESANSVGIGIDIPDEKFVVAGNGVFARISNASTVNGGLKISYQNLNTHGLHLLYYPADAVAYIDNTYPISSGQVFGDLQFRQNVSGSMTQRMIIKAENGNIGIGTISSPAEKLHVVGNIVATGSITASYSDYNLKTNISDLTDGLNLILDLKPKTFNFISDNNLGLEDDLIVGLIAQDVEQSLSAKPYLNSIIKQIGDYKAIDIHKIIPITVKAIQEQQAIIETQEQKITDLETTIQSLITRIENLENK